MADGREAIGDVFEGLGLGSIARSRYLNLARQEAMLMGMDFDAAPPEVQRRIVTRIFQQGNDNRMTRPVGR